MFPGVDGFHRTFTHIVFLSVFFTVLLTILGTLASAALRTADDVRKGRAVEICWKAEFAQLPEAERRCRHELAGRVAHRVCPNAFDCRHCSEYAHYAALPARNEGNTLGLSYPSNRLYHRGHTWVAPQDDGTLTVGLDDMAAHLIGDPDTVELPGEGAKIQSDGTAWRMKKNGHAIRVRAPIDGTVVETGGPEKGWYLHLRPHGTVDLRHLLRGPEVAPWLAREIERLQFELGPPKTGPALADGGVLVAGLLDAMPEADWDTALAGTFLEA
jgi:hypothetical protein